MTTNGLIICFIVVYVLYIWVALQPRLQFMANGDVWLFVTWDGKREGIILVYGKV